MIASLSFSGSPLKGVFTLPACFWSSNAFVILLTASTSTGAKGFGCDAGSIVPSKGVFVLGQVVMMACDALEENGV